MGNFNITVNEKNNQPPTQVGDNAKSVDYGVPLVFTEAMFTTETTPQYLDPEGDNPYKLKITSLPSNGALELDGVPVTLNQEILFSDINLGKFVFVPDNNILTANNVDFDFEISDEGSKTFVG